MEQTDVEKILNALAAVTKGKTLAFSGGNLYVNGEDVGTTSNVAEVLRRYIK